MGRLVGRRWSSRSVGFRLRVRVVVGLVLACVLPAAAAPAQTQGAGSSVQWSIDQLDRILGATPLGNDVQVGDMVFSRPTIERGRDQLAGRAPEDPTRATSSPGTTFWPGGNVYYQFDAGVSAPHREHFLDAAQEWTAFANLRFVARTVEANYITVKDVPGLNGGNSFVGVRGGEQLLNIGSDAWNRKTLVHEIGHAIGFQHEHQRSDRDTFVTILTANIQSGQEGNFVILPGSVNYGAYDFLSVMHYPRTAFSVDPATKDTIQPKAAYSGFLDQMGNQYDRPQSRLDRLAVATPYGPPAVAPNGVVTSTKDSGPGTLRAAIYYAFDRADAVPGTTTAVQFQIPPADPNFDGTVFTIRPTAVLPAFGNGTTVDGQTQTSFGGNTNPTGPEVVINGSKILPSEQYAGGVVMRGTNSTLRNVVVNQFANYGVRIRGSGATGNVVAGSYIGTDRAGAAAVPNSFAGVEITSGAHGNTVGGSAAGDGNVVSGNASYGVSVNGTGTSGNRLLGNVIGLGATGTGALANVGAGVVIFAGASTNTVGAGNTISGNQSSGVRISQAGTDGNVVEGSRIGLTVSGTAGVANGSSGVSIYGGAKSNRVGGSAPGQGNVVSGNTFAGVAISEAGTDLNVVEGNLIGTDAAGSAAVANSYGVGIFAGAASNRVGGTVAGARNVISGNTNNGVNIAGLTTRLNTVVGNYVGLRGTGVATLGNGGNGLQLYDQSSDNTVGGTTAGSRNYFAGNVFAGVALSGSGTTANHVQGNTIGQNANGAPAANAQRGVVLFNGSTANEIGGVAAGAGNVIANNTGQGVGIYDATTTGNSILGNSISANSGIGIDLGGGSQIGGGVTVNDAGDADSGPNGLQNYPVLTSATTAGAVTTVGGTLNSTATTTFRIEVFSSPTADPSGYGEGTTMLGSTTATTDGAGNAAFTLVAAQAVAPGGVVTATAISPVGDTSEFAAARVVEVAARAPADFNGDGKTDFGVFRPPNGAWYVALAGGGATSANWGASGDIPVPGDYNGDGKTDFAIFRPSTGGWYVAFAGGGSTSASWGASDDIPVPGDYNGDGKTDFAIFRPSTGGWYVAFAGGGATSASWGASGDVPVPGDYNGDGKTDFGIYRPAAGAWYVALTGGGATSASWGLSTDVPLPLPQAIWQRFFAGP
jgi:hypothetical protein